MGRLLSRVRFVLTLSAASCAVAACGALLGIEEVTLSERDAGPDRTGEPNDDGSAPAGPDGRPPDGAVSLDDRGALALGYNHTCARLPGKVLCWGSNGSGQLGDGLPFGTDRPAVPKPQPVPGVTDAIALGAGLLHTCAVLEDRTMSCWGNNTYGQLGDGTNERSSKPVKVVNLQGVAAVSGGASFTCALRSDQTVWCWGANFAGQLGDGLTTNRSTPAPVKGLSTAVSIAAGANHACAALTSGEVRCWGGNEVGQLGSGSTTSSGTPTRAGSLSDVVQVTASDQLSCARHKTGKISCWGSNAHGQVGIGSVSDAPVSSPTALPSVNDAIFVAAGSEHACAVRAGGTLSCWGRAGEGQLGNGPADDGASVSTPVSVIGAPAAVGVWAGGNRSCALARDGRVFCWGQNSSGQLGNGTTDRAFTATPVVGIP